MKIGKYEIAEVNDKIYLSILNEKNELTGESMEITERLLDGVWEREY